MACWMQLVERKRASHAATDFKAQPKHVRHSLALGPCDTFVPCHVSDTCARRPARRCRRARIRATRPRAWARRRPARLPWPRTRRTRLPARRRRARLERRPRRPVCIGPATPECIAFNLHASLQAQPRKTEPLVRLKQRRADVQCCMRFISASPQLLGVLGCWRSSNGYCAWPA